jgi:hypothetical protein
MTAWLREQEAQKRFKRDRSSDISDEREKIAE